MASDPAYCFCGQPHGAGHTHDVTEVEWLRARLAEAERLLRGYEWSAWKFSYGVACCIECAGEEPTHTPDCALARWLEGGER